jgi:hypothetical protein
MPGHMYIFNTPVFQENNDGAGGLGGDSRIIKHCTTRNNIFHVRQEDRRSIAVSRSQSDNDFNYDLTSAALPDNQEKDGLKGAPQYVPGAGFDPETKTGMFQLAPGSRGTDAAEVVPNFCEAIHGNRPDIGAHQSGTGRMQFGLRARFTPPGSPESAQKEPAGR